MKLLPFSELCETYFDLHSITVVSHFWRQGDRFSTPKGGRPDNGIMLLTNCAFDYIDNGRVTDSAHRTQLVYMPIGSCYSCRSSPSPDLSPGEPSDYLINFRIFDEDGCELRLADDRLTLDMDSPRIAETFVRIVSLSSIASPPLARVKSLLYELLCELSLELARHDVMMNRRYAAISPAIERIRSAKLSELDPAGLASLCHISTSCFRRLFGEYFGVPPLEYLNRLKAERARELLRSHQISVSEVADLLGFDDVSYFSRFYKKQTGLSPSEEMRESVLRKKT